MSTNVKQKIFQVIEPAKRNDKLSKAFDVCILLLISINILSVILESFNFKNLIFNNVFNTIEIISVIIFSIEYLFRVYTADLHYHESKYYKALIKYLKSPMAIIDLLAIIPFYLPFLIPIDLRILRILRLVRVLRIFKINRYTKSFGLIAKVFKRKKDELFVTLFVTVIMLFLSASIIYLSEGEAQPNKFPNIIASLWWAVATLTTVGYGDVYPITITGKIISGVIALLGVGVVALPTGIISSGFIEELEKNNESLIIRKRSKKIQKGRRKLLKIKAGRSRR